MASEIDRLIEKLKDKINDDDCFDFGLHIDCCRIKASGYKLKVRFDWCANEYFSVDGGCDCIFIFSDKVCVVECTRGKFSDSDANVKFEQLRKCYHLIRSLGYKGFVQPVIYFGKSAKASALSKIRNKIKKEFNVVPKICKCDKDPIG